MTRVAARDGIEYLLWRHALPDREVTTLYAVRDPRRSTRTRVVYFPRPERLDVWSRRNGVEEAVVGGFFLRDPYRPLGELWIDGRRVHHEPVASPHAQCRGSVVIDDGDVRLVERDAAPTEPTGDLVQAGPLLVADGTIVFDAGTTKRASSLAPRARSTSTAAARPRSCTAGISSTARTPARTSRRRSLGRS